VRKPFITLALIAALAAIFYIWKSNNSVPPQESSATERARSNTNNRSQKSDIPVSRAETLRRRIVSPEPNLDNRVKRYTDGSVDLTNSVKISSQLHRSANPQEDLKIVSQILSQYRTVFRENPVGVENFEFTAALTGENPKRVNFLDPTHSALSEKNELIDRQDSLDRRRHKARVLKGITT